MCANLTPWTSLGGSGKFSNFATMHTYRITTPHRKLLIARGDKTQVRVLSSCTCRYELKHSKFVVKPPGGMLSTKGNHTSQCNCGGH